MPLLSLEPFVFPDDLLQTPRNPENLERWWVLHTRPRAEKALARRFLGRGLPFFLPLHQRTWRSNGRQFRSYMPLFPSYIFLRGDDTIRLAALETNQIAHVIPVEDQEQLQTDLARIHYLMATGEPLTPEEALEPGDLVEITAGPFAGLVGKVIRRKNGLKLLVEVQFLQRGVSVEIETWMIQAVREPSTAVACR